MFIALLRLLWVMLMTTIPVLLRWRLLYSWLLLIVWLRGCLVMVVAAAATVLFPWGCRCCLFKTLPLFRSLLFLPLLCLLAEHVWHLRCTFLAFLGPVVVFLNGGSWLMLRWKAHVLLNWVQHGLLGILNSVLAFTGHRLLLVHQRSLTVWVSRCGAMVLVVRSAVREMLRFRAGLRRFEHLCKLGWLTIDYCVNFIVWQERASTVVEARVDTFANELGRAIIKGIVFRHAALVIWVVKAQTVTRIFS